MDYTQLKGWWVWRCQKGEPAKMLLRVQDCIVGKHKGPMGTLLSRTVDDDGNITVTHHCSFPGCDYTTFEAVSQCQPYSWLQVDG